MILPNNPLRSLSRSSRGNLSPLHRRNRNRPPGMHFQIHLIPRLQMSQLQQRRIKNNPVRVPNLRNRLNHGKTMFYIPPPVKANLPPSPTNHPSLSICTWNHPNRPVSLTA